MLYQYLKKLVGFEPSSKGHLALYKANTFARQLEHEYNAFPLFLIKAGDLEGKFGVH